MSDQLEHKKTWAEMADEEEEEDEVENNNTIQSDNRQFHDFDDVPNLKKTQSEMNPYNEKKRERKSYKNQNSTGTNKGLKGYNNQNQYEKKFKNDQSYQNFHHRDNQFEHRDEYSKKQGNDSKYKHHERNITIEQQKSILIDTDNENILIKCKIQNQTAQLPIIKSKLQLQYPDCLIFIREDLNQLDLILSPKTALKILEDNSYQNVVEGVQISFFYPKRVNEKLSEFYLHKKYLDKREIKQNIQVTRSSFKSKEFSETQPENNDLGQQEQQQQQQQQQQQYKDNSYQDQDYDKDSQNRDHEFEQSNHKSHQKEGQKHNNKPYKYKSHSEKSQIPQSQYIRKPISDFQDTQQYKRKDQQKPKNKYSTQILYEEKHKPDENPEINEVIQKNDELSDNENENEDNQMDDQDLDNQQNQNIQSSSQKKKKKKKPKNMAQYQVGQGNFFTPLSQAMKS